MSRRINKHIEDAERKIERDEAGEEEGRVIQVKELVEKEQGSGEGIVDRQVKDEEFYSPDAQLQRTAR